MSALRHAPRSRRTPRTAGAGPCASARACSGTRCASSRPAVRSATRSCSSSGSAPPYDRARRPGALRAGRRAPGLHRSRSPPGSGSPCYFANLAEAAAEGRGKAQADGPAPHAARRARQAAGLARARRRADRGPRRRSCARATSCSSSPATSCPCDGTVIEGVASVDESAVTGESAPVIRESGGDRSAVTGGTRVLSDWLVVEVTRRPGRDVPRPDDRARRGRQAQEDAERDRARHPARGPLDRVPAGRRDAAAVLALRRRRRRAGRRRVDHGPRRAPRLPHPDHDRRPALGHRHRGHGPHGAQERDRHLRPRRRGGGRRGRAAARQDGHDHAGQPPGRRVPARAGRERGGARRRGAARLARRRDPRGAQHRRPRQAALRAPRAQGRRAGRHVRPLHRADAHERRRRRRARDPQGRRRRRRGVRGRARRAHPRRRSRTAVERVARAGATPARRRRRRPRPRRHRAPGHREGRHPRALRRAAPHGHQDGDDHRRQRR